MDIRELIDKLAEQEQASLGRSFLAPVVKGGRVCVRIGGVICQFGLQDPEFEGWGIFKPVSLHTVRLESKPKKSLVRQYRQHLTPVELVLADPAGNVRAETTGRCSGRIVFAEAGPNGFGYDPLFEIVEYHRTFGELGPAAKSCLSHRSRAVQAMIPQVEATFRSTL